jgi:hypothetical protein
MRLWIVLWPVGEDARLIEAGDLRSEMFNCLTEESLQLFLGTAAIAPHPLWCTAGGRREIDFQRSYAVQLVPSVIAPDAKTLLEGRMAILRSDQYADAEAAKELIALFRRLQSEMKRASDHQHVVVQTLTNGEKKKWRNILVGRELPSSNIVQLKQFAQGAVTFEVTHV